MDSLGDSESRFTSSFCDVVGRFRCLVSFRCCRSFLGVWLLFIVFSFKLMSRWVVSKVFLKHVHLDLVGRFPF